MEERAQGIVMRTRLLTETSLIVHWLTKEHGRVATVAKGARRAKSPFRGKVDLFFRADLTFLRSKRSDLHNLLELALIDTHEALRGNLDYLHQAAYGTALIEQTTESETPIPAIYNLYAEFLAVLPRNKPEAKNIFALELKLLEQLGLNPIVEQSTSGLSAGTKMLADKLMHEEWSKIQNLKLSMTQVAEFRQMLQRFMTFHLGELPRSRQAAVTPAAKV